jgi:hypothetical protein
MLPEIGSTMASTVVQLKNAAATHSETLMSICESREYSKMGQTRSRETALQFV